MKRLCVPVTVALLCAYLTASPVIGNPPERDEHPTFSALPKSGGSQGLGRLKVNSGGPALDNSAGRSSFRAAKSPGQADQRPDAGREFRAKTVAAPGLLANAPVRRTTARTTSSAGNLKHNAIPKGLGRNALSSTQAAAKQVGGQEPAQLLVQPGTAADIQK